MAVANLVLFPRFQIATKNAEKPGNPRSKKRLVGNITPFSQRRRPRSFYSCASRCFPHPTAAVIQREASYGTPRRAPRSILRRCGRKTPTRYLAASENHPNLRRRDLYIFGLNSGRWPSFWFFCSGEAFHRKVDRLGGIGLSTLPCGIRAKYCQLSTSLPAASPYHVSTILIGPPSVDASFIRGGGDSPRR